MSRALPTACGRDDCHINREQNMTVVERDADDVPTVWCDPCIAPLVEALNSAGIRTLASCCGHGFRPGFVALADGRELVIARDFDEARSIAAMFPTDINGTGESR